MMKLPRSRNSSLAAAICDPVQTFVIGAPSKLGTSSFFGCGRWKTILTPLSATLILEPLPSLISAPRTTNKVSIFDHSTSDQVGSSNMVESVFLCFELIDICLVEYGNNSQRKLTVSVFSIIGQKEKIFGKTILG